MPTPCSVASFLCFLFVTSTTDGFSLVHSAITTSTRRDVMEQFQNLSFLTTAAAAAPPPLATATAQSSPAPTIAVAAPTTTLVGGGGGGDGGNSEGSSYSTMISSSSSISISASWQAVDGLNSLDSNKKFVSFDDAAYRAMINDPSRTPLFERAIIHRLQTLSSSSQSNTNGGPVVLDLGTGPYAHFAIVAAKHGAGRVYAVEASAEAAASARNAVRASGYADKITVLEGFSTDVALPDGRRADLAIAEIVGSVASEEGGVATILDAHRRWLENPNDASSWIPSGMQTYAAPASYSLHNLFRPPEFDWTKLNGEPVRFNCRDEGLQLLSAPVLVEDISFPDILEFGRKGRLSSGQRRRRITFTVDGKRIDDNIIKFNEEYSRGRIPEAKSLAIAAANSVSGIALWPRLLLDADTQINSRHFPDGAHQRSHWQTVLPIMSPEPVAVKGGDEITVDFDFDVSTEVTAPPSYKISGSVLRK